MKIGVLDIQGSVKEHVAALNRRHVTAVLAKKPGDFEEIGGLIIPGGESTTILSLLETLPKNLPIFGTCAGAIVLARLGLLDVEIERNAYGRQLQSFETEISIPVIGERKFNAIFIRAPKFKKVGGKVEILAKCKSDPVLVRQGKILAATFHPELTSDTRVHEYFLKIVDGN